MHGLKSKRAVTEPILIIGVLVIAATILILGTTRVLVPLIKTQEGFLAKDLAATVRTVIAAPENLNINHKINAKEGYSAHVAFYSNTLNFNDYHNDDEYSKSTDAEFTGDTLLSKSFKHKWNSVYYYFGTNPDKQFILNKIYSNADRKNKLIFDCKGCVHP